MKKIAVLALFMSSLLAASPAAADAYIEVVPTNWRMQNYIPDILRVFYVGTTCFAQGIEFPPSTTADDKNRFFSMVLKAQATNTKVGVYYETVSGACQITSFFPVP